ncbi:MAG: DUF4097 family beta strand repeat-containing protein [Clostridia bacterium]|nr:DUF4097 family beta strand repeat-containing protein [Clostridia bacterium]
MNSVQRIIKYLAVAFAIFLTVNIIFGIVMAVTSIFSITSLVTHEEISSEKITYSEVFTDINYLDIDVGISKLYIKQGNEFKVEAKDVTSKFKVNVVDGTLQVEEKTNKIFNVNSDQSEIYIYLPKDVILEKSKIYTGVGKSSIAGFQSKELELHIGLGDLSVDNVAALQSSKIKGGVGKTSLNNCDLKNLNLDCGVGNIIISTKVSGNSEAKCGIGNLDFTILGNQDDYTIKTEIGIGVMKLNGSKVSSDNTIGTGNNMVKFDCGIGNVEINFEKQNETDF